MCIECYRQYIHHFKKGFPYVSKQSFNEGEINMSITIMTCQIKHIKRGRGKLESVQILGKYTLVVTIYGLNL